jgi:4-hydroxy-3-methylbut-2-enyl diphosphate reductase
MKKAGGQVVIYGKEGHAEVMGLNGQTRNNAIIVSSEDDLDKIDFHKSVILFSQTTKSTEGFYHIVELIKARIKSNGNGSSPSFIAHDSICRQVSNRTPHLIEFSRDKDVILFVSSKKSSNGKALFEVCSKHNPRSYFIENEDDIDYSWFADNDTIGICGATSTPRWLMKKVEERIQVSGKQMV